MDEMLYGYIMMTSADSDLRHCISRALNLEGSQIVRFFENHTILSCEVLFSMYKPRIL